jgi:transposase
MRTPGSAAALELRRRHAASLLADGFDIAEVVELVGASLTSVKRWKRALAKGGDAALAAKAHPGPKPRLTVKQREELVELMLEGAKAAGFPSDLWTCPRVAALIQERWGVAYHVGHVARLLHELGFSPQKPERRARERDEQAIAAWRESTWPRIKKRAVAFKLASFLSTNPGSSCSL